MTIISTDIKFYYSGGSSNSDPNASLGGVKSSVEVTGSINNVFDDVSGDEAAAGDTEYRIIYCQNTSSDSNGLMSPGKVWIDSDTSGADDLEICVASASGEVTANGDESTWGGTGFGSWSNTAVSKATGLDIPSLPLSQDEYFAIGLKRVVPSSCASTASDTATIKVEGDTI